MNALFLITGLGVGGAERQVVDIADHMAMQGWRVAICYLTGPASIIPINSDVKLVGLGMKKSPLGFVRAYFSLRKLIQSFKPDVVHSHMVHANLLGRFVRLSTPMKKLVCTAHSTNEGGKVRMWAYRMTAFLADVTTNVSKEAVEAFVRAGASAPDAMLVVGNGIDTQRFCPNLPARLTLRQQLGVDPNQKILLAVGRLSAAKDYPNLLQAYSRLIASGAKQSLLCIVGDGELKDELRTLAESLGLINQVRFLGYQSNVFQWMNAADIFVLSSAWEGLPLVIGEAMACEKVVVATDVGGVKEVLGDCGFLAPKCNFNALAQSLNQALMLTEHEALIVGRRARERAIIHYSLDSIVQRWLEIYSIN